MAHPFDQAVPLQAVDDGGGGTGRVAEEVAQVPHPQRFTGEGQHPECPEPRHGGAVVAQPPVDEDAQPVGGGEQLVHQGVAAAEGLYLCHVRRFRVPEPSTDR